MHRVQQQLTSWVISSLIDIADVKPDDIRGTLLLGSAQLRRVQLHLHRINQEIPGFVPFECVGAAVDEITLAAPWYTLSAKPIEVSVVGVDIVIAPRTDSRAGDATSRLGAKEMRAEALRLYFGIDASGAAIDGALQPAAAAGGGDATRNAAEPETSDSAPVHSAGPDDDAASDASFASCASGTETAAASSPPPPPFSPATVDRNSTTDGDDFQSCASSSPVQPPDAMTPLQSSSTSDEDTPPDATAAQGWGGWLTSAVSAVVPTSVLSREVRVAVRDVRISVQCGDRAVLITVDNVAVAFDQGDEAKPRIVDVTGVRVATTVLSTGESAELVPEFGLQVTQTLTTQKTAAGTKKQHSHLSATLFEAIHVHVAGETLEGFAGFAKALEREWGVPAILRPLQTLRYSKRCWEYVCEARRARVADRRRRWNLSLDFLVEMRAKRDALLDVLGRGIASPAVAKSCIDEVVAKEDDIRFVDVIEFLRYVAKVRANVAATNPVLKSADDAAAGDSESIGVWVKEVCVHLPCASELVVSEIDAQIAALVDLTANDAAPQHSVRVKGINLREAPPAEALVDVPLPEGSRMELTLEPYESQNDALELTVEPPAPRRKHGTGEKRRSSGRRRTAETINVRGGIVTIVVSLDYVGRMIEAVGPTALAIGAAVDAYDVLVRPPEQRHAAHRSVHKSTEILPVLDVLIRNVNLDVDGLVRARVFNISGRSATRAVHVGGSGSLDVDLVMRDSTMGGMRPVITERFTVAVDVDAHSARITLPNRVAIDASPEFVAAGAQCAECLETRIATLTMIADSVFPPKAPAAGGATPQLDASSTQMPSFAAAGLNSSLADISASAGSRNASMTATPMTSPARVRDPGFTISLFVRDGVHIATGTACLQLDVGRVEASCNTKTLEATARVTTFSLAYHRNKGDDDAPQRPILSVAGIALTGCFAEDASVSRVDAELSVTSVAIGGQALRVALQPTAVTMVMPKLAAYAQAVTVRTGVVLQLAHVDGLLALVVTVDDVVAGVERLIAAASTPLKRREVPTPLAPPSSADNTADAKNQGDPTDPATAPQATQIVAHVSVSTARVGALSGPATVIMWSNDETHLDTTVNDDDQHVVPAIAPFSTAEVTLQTDGGEAERRNGLEISLNATLGAAEQSVVVSLCDAADGVVSANVMVPPIDEGEHDTPRTTAMAVGVVTTAVRVSGCAVDLTTLLGVASAKPSAVTSLRQSASDPAALVPSTAASAAPPSVPATGVPPSSAPTNASGTLGTSSDQLTSDRVLTSPTEVLTVRALRVDVTADAQRVVHAAVNNVRVVAASLDDVNMYLRSASVTAEASEMRSFAVHMSRLVNEFAHPQDATHHHFTRIWGNVHRKNYRGDLAVEVSLSRQGVPPSLAAARAPMSSAAPPPTGIEDVGVVVVSECKFTLRNSSSIRICDGTFVVFRDCVFALDPTVASITAGISVQGGAGVAIDPSCTITSAAPIEDATQVFKAVCLLLPTKALRVAIDEDVSLCIRGGREFPTWVATASNATATAVQEQRSDGVSSWDDVRLITSDLAAPQCSVTRYYGGSSLDDLDPASAHHVMRQASGRVAFELEASPARGVSRVHLALSGGSHTVSVNLAVLEELQSAAACFDVFFDNPSDAVGDPRIFSILRSRSLGADIAALGSVVPDTLSFSFQLTSPTTVRLAPSSLPFLAIRVSDATALVNLDTSDSEACSVDLAAAFGVDVFQHGRLEYVPLLHDTDGSVSLRHVWRLIAAASTSSGPLSNPNLQEQTSFATTLEASISRVFLDTDQRFVAALLLAMRQAERPARLLMEPASPVAGAHNLRLPASVVVVDHVGLGFVLKCTQVVPSVSKPSKKRQKNKLAVCEPFGEATGAWPLEGKAALGILTGPARGTGTLPFLIACAARDPSTGSPMPMMQRLHDTFFTRVMHFGHGISVVGRLRVTHDAHQVSLLTPFIVHNRLPIKIRFGDGAGIDPQDSGCVGFGVMDTPYLLMSVLLLDGTEARHFFDVSGRCLAQLATCQRPQSRVRRFDVVFRQPPTSVDQKPLYAFADLTFDSDIGAPQLVIRPTLVVRNDTPSSLMVHIHESQAAFTTDSWTADDTVEVRRAIIAVGDHIALLQHNPRHTLAVSVTSGKDSPTPLVSNQHKVSIHQRPPEAHGEADDREEHPLRFPLFAAKATQRRKDAVVVLEARMRSNGRVLQLFKSLRPLINASGTELFIDQPGGGPTVVAPSLPTPIADYDHAWLSTVEVLVPADRNISMRFKMTGASSSFTLVGTDDDDIVFDPVNMPMAAPPRLRDIDISLAHKVHLKWSSRRCTVMPFWIFKNRLACDVRVEHFGCTADDHPVVHPHSRVEEFRLRQGGLPKAYTTVCFSPGTREVCRHNAFRFGLVNPDARTPEEEVLWSESFVTNVPKAGFRRFYLHIAGRTTCLCVTVGRDSDDPATPVRVRVEYEAGPLVALYNTTRYTAQAQCARLASRSRDACMVVRAEGAATFTPAQTHAGCRRRVVTLQVDNKAMDIKLEADSPSEHVAWRKKLSANVWVSVHAVWQTEWHLAPHEGAIRFVVVLTTVLNSERGEVTTGLQQARAGMFYDIVHGSMKLSLKLNQLDVAMFPLAELSSPLLALELTQASRDHNVVVLDIEKAKLRDLTGWIDEDNILDETSVHVVLHNMSFYYVVGPVLLVTTGRARVSLSDPIMLSVSEDIIGVAMEFFQPCLTAAPSEASLLGQSIDMGAPEAIPADKLVTRAPLRPLFHSSSYAVSDFKLVLSVKRTVNRDNMLLSDPIFLFVPSVKCAHISLRPFVAAPLVVPLAALPGHLLFHYWEQWTTQIAAYLSVSDALNRDTPVLANMLESTGALMETANNRGALGYLFGGIVRRSGRALRAANTPVLVISESTAKAAAAAARPQDFGARCEKSADGHFKEYLFDAPKPLQYKRPWLCEEYDVVEQRLAQMDSPRPDVVRWSVGTYGTMATALALPLRDVLLHAPPCVVVRDLATIIAAAQLRICFGKSLDSLSLPRCAKDDTALVMRILKRMPGDGEDDAAVVAAVAAWVMKGAKDELPVSVMRLAVASINVGGITDITDGPPDTAEPATSLEDDVQRYVRALCAQTTAE